MEAASYVAQAGKESEAKFESIGKKIIQELVKRKDRKMTFNEFLNFTDDDKNVNKLLQTDVFCYNVVDRTVIFQSHLIESYVIANPKEFGLK